MASLLSPLVSVIIRTKDRPRLLSEALNSVVSQTYPNMEIVLVNDGGADVKAMAERIVSNMPLVYVCHETNRGRSAAANSGLMAATGQYLNFLDDDDVFYPDHIETLLAALEADDGRVAYSSVLTVYYAGTPENSGQRIREEVVFNRKFESDRLLFENYIPLMSVLFSRDVLEKVPSFDEKMELFEDWDFWMRISRFIEFLHVDKITAEYRFFGYQRAEESHQKKYAYDQALGVMFEKALPYMNARAWLHFLNEGLVGWLRLLQKQTEDRLHEIETMYAKLHDEYDACLARANDLSSQLDTVRKEYDILAGEMTPMSSPAPHHRPIRKDMVSVCIPTYNGSDYLQEAIQSVLLQTYRHIELIIVDDRSTDDTVEIAEKLTQGFPNVTILRNANRQGLGGNWNKCLEAATGEWIKFLFQDDRLAPDCIEKLHRLAVRTNHALAVCGRQFDFEDNIPESYREKFLHYVQMNSFSNRFPDCDGVIDAGTFAVHALAYPTYNCIGEPTAVLFHHLTVSEFGYFNPDLSQIIDWEYWMRVAANKGLCFTHEKLATFRIHDKGMSAANWFDDRQILVDKIDELIVYHEQYYKTYYSALYQHDAFIRKRNITLKRLMDEYAAIQALLRQYPVDEVRMMRIEKYRPAS